MRPSVEGDLTQRFEIKSNESFIREIIHLGVGCPHSLGTQHDHSTYTMLC